MKIDTKIRHVTKPGANLFLELGFAPDEAKRLQAASRKQINDTRLLKQQLMKELGAAINDTLSNSDRISEAIAKIRSSGYDVFLVLEATIGFNRRNETADESAETIGVDGEAELNITSQDVKFLKSLKISIDDREAN